MAKQKLPTRLRAWEKAGRPLLSEYLDTLAPDVREWIDEMGLTEWPY